ncbi:MAG TPA: hypothetical protein DC057_12425 [Spirochaetia bacterium]|nr:hypothetical protein [Spirochaetia bacterium]
MFKIIYSIFIIFIALSSLAIGKTWENTNFSGNKTKNINALNFSGHSYFHEFEKETALNNMLMECLDKCIRFILKDQTEKSADKVKSFITNNSKNGLNWIAKIRYKINSTGRVYYAESVDVDIDLVKNIYQQYVSELEQNQKKELEKLRLIEEKDLLEKTQQNGQFEKYFQTTISNYDPKWGFKNFYIGMSMQAIEQEIMQLKNSRYSVLIDTKELNTICQIYDIRPIIRRSNPDRTIKEFYWQNDNFLISLINNNILFWLNTKDRQKYTEDIYKSLAIDFDIVKKLASTNTLHIIKYSYNDNSLTGDIVFYFNYYYRLMCIEFYINKNEIEVLYLLNNKYGNVLEKTEEKNNVSKNFREYRFKANDDLSNILLFHYIVDNKKSVIVYYNEKYFINHMQAIYLFCSKPAFDKYNLSRLKLNSDL